MEKIGFKHSTLAELEGHSYDQSDLLKLYLYGYLNQVRSSRKLERECHWNIEVIWLVKKQAPDFKTIADFRKDNIDCVKGVFKEFVKLCRGLDLFGAKCVVVDGTKFKAVNYLDSNFNRKKTVYRMKMVDEHIAKYFSEIEQDDSREKQTNHKHAEVLDAIRAMLLVEPQKLSLKKRIVEHPFGTMKRAFNQGYLLLMGLGKLAEKWVLLCWLTI
jgi:transposase